MWLSKQFCTLFAVCIFFILFTQTAYADSRYLSVDPGESVETSNGDDTNTRFVLDPLATTKAEFHVDAEWWRMVYDAVRQEVKRLTPSKYSERGEDIIVLLHSRPMDHLRIAKLRFRLTDGQIVPAGELDEERALRLASYMFLQPEVEREYTTLGWFYWAPSQEFDVLALDCRDSGEITIHELAHAFTAYDTNTEERERIAENVVESLCGNEEFMARMHESALTPHLSAPAPVSLEEYISNT